jgi:hypothetical protein
LRAARDGASVALIAKTAEPHPRLEGTVFTAAEQIEQAGGRASATSATRRRSRTPSPKPSIGSAASTSA